MKKMKNYHGLHFFKYNFTFQKLFISTRIRKLIDLYFQMLDKMAKHQHDRQKIKRQKKKTGKKIFVFYSA